MTIQHSQRAVAVLLLLAAGACTREEAHHDVDRVANGTEHAGEKLDVSLQRAKQEAHQMGDKLKAFGEQVKQDAKDAREDIRRHVN